jgi:prepilin-type N-terminal cleavage/methylation domain-containing protein
MTTMNILDSELRQERRQGHQRRISREHGFTLVELMIVVGILAVISAVALPFYTDYIETSQQAALINNISTIETFQEDFRLRNGAYQPGVFNAGSDADLVALGWAPQSDDGTTYTIVLAGGSYRVTATNPEGSTVCMQFPEKIDCP